MTRPPKSRIRRIIEHISLRAAALKLGYLTEKEFEEWVKPEQMTHP